MNSELPQLSFAAEQLVGQLGSDAPAELGSFEWIIALIDRAGRVAGEVGPDLDLRELRSAAQRSVDVGDPGPARSRDDIATAAGIRAATQGRELANVADVALVILEPGRESLVGVITAGPEPAPLEQRPEPAASILVPEPTPTFRVFVSSTFEDLAAERDVLRLRVFPRVRRFCSDRGARFQAIDLRWGISEEAGLDQQTLAICLAEIERCRAVTPRPNFLVLLGNHYGWQPPPARIPASELDEILGLVAEGDRALLGCWYRLDENAVPAEYRLLPRTGDRDAYADPRRWRPVEQELRAILAAASTRLSLGRERRRAYAASATEQEIAVGALAPETVEGQVLCFFRELTGRTDATAVPEGDPLRRFVDPDQTPLDALKAELRRRLPGTIQTYEVGWDGDCGVPGDEHLDRLAEDAAAALEAAIERGLHCPVSPVARPAEGPAIRADDLLDAEGDAHRRFAEERRRFFVGRAVALEEIDAYLDGTEPIPLVLHGAGGTGKSALLAEALRRAQDAHPAAVVLYRFIGATPGSVDVRALLAGLCRELARRSGGDVAAVPFGYRELVADFAQRLAAARSPLIVFVDSLDQLSATWGARSLGWLPAHLPGDVRLVVSTRPGETLLPLQRGGAALLELGPLSRSDGDELLGRWLDDARRTLRPGQRQAVLDAFARASGNPLYLRLAFEEARRWASDVPPERLAGGIEGIIRANSFVRLAREESHGEVLVAHVLGYLAAARHGLAEDELLDLLSRDLDVYRWFLTGAFHLPPDLVEWAARDGRRGDASPEAWLDAVRRDPRRREELDSFLADVVSRLGGPNLPVVLWSRLSFDLAPYLTERVAEGGNLLTFFHRELGDASAAAFHADGRGRLLHGRIADYFRSRADVLGDGSWGGAGRSDVRGLSELPYHLAAAGRAGELADTMTDFRFLERKSGEVGVVQDVGEVGTVSTTYTGVYHLLDDFDLALGDRDPAPARRRLIVTAVDLGGGLFVRCPHCDTSSPLLDEWRGAPIACPACDGPLRVNPFVGERTP